MKTLSEVWADYLSKNGDRKYNTKEAYKKAWNKLISAIGDKCIFEVNSKDIEDFRSWLFEQGYNPKTVDTSMRNASPVMAWAVRRNYRVGNPFQGVRKPTIPEKEIKVYTEAELYAMLRCANLIWQARIITAASAGLRRTEILNLTRNDVKFEKGYITVQAKEATRYTWPWSSKSNKSRQVPLSIQLEDVFTEILAKLPEKQPYIMLTDKRYCGLQKMRQRKELCERLRITPDESNRRWETIRRRARIWDKNFHHLRSTAITNWILSGIPIHEVKRLAGHADISITEKYYAACRSDYVQRAKLTVGATGLEPATS
jgi:integrase